jgi:hypothetical protein
MKYELPSNLSFENLGEFLKDLLKQYQNGVIDMDCVMNYGEMLQEFLWEKYGDPENPVFPNFEQYDYRNLLCKIVDYLEGFRANFAILPRDVPHFIEFLDTTKGQEKEGWKKFREYIEFTKTQDRRREEQKQGMHRSGDPYFEDLGKTNDNNKSG